MNIARGCAASKCAWKPWHPRRFSRSGIDVTRRRRTRVRMDVFPSDVKRNKGISDLLPCLAGFPYVEPIRSYQIHDWMMLGLGDVVPTSRMWQCPKWWEISLWVQAAARVLPWGEWWPEAWCAQIVEACWGRDQHFCQEDYHWNSLDLKKTAGFGHENELPFALFRILELHLSLWSGPLNDKHADL